MSKEIDWQDHILDNTEYARDDEACKELRAYLRTKGFDPVRLLFAELINGMDDVRYGMFVTPEGRIYDFEEDLHSHRFFNFKTYDSVQEAAERIPLVINALEMIEAPVA